MNNRYKRLVALLLACVLSIGALPAYAREFELPEDSFEDPALNAANASFSANTKTDDNALKDGEGWYPNHPVGTYVFDVQWDTTNLYIAVYHPDTTSKLQPTAVTFVSNAYKSSDTTEVYSEFSWSTFSTHYTACTEIIVPLGDVNISGVTDYGVKIPASITVGTNTWEGTIVLSSTKWDHTTYSNPATFGPQIVTPTRGGTASSTNQGTGKVTGGIHIYDKYYSNHTPAVRIHARYGAYDENGNLTDQMNAFNYCEFDMKISSLPVYKLGDSAAQDYRYAVHGINWLMWRKDTYGISMGIINTEDGLVFVLRTDGPDQTVRLNRNVGDTLHLGCRWEADDSLTLLLDGEKLANLKNAKMRLGYSYTMLEFISLRSDEKATSAADNIDVTVTNIAVGNSYGESLLDRLTFDDIKGNNVNQYAITQKLSLPTDPDAGPLSNGGTISWSSSAPSIIATDGTVNRPSVSTKVTLTASYGGTSKRFTLTVLGKNPTGNYLFVENDLKTATGAGSSSTEDFSFTLDRYNGSIIYNQGTAQKVNVIELVDSDASNRLNESVLTVWYSNDNATYTQLEDSFKILRKGNKTYLYDFEIEAKYIKVHCTHYDTYEADFTNTITDMIKVDYVEMAFRNESQVVLENDSNTAAYDQPYTITLENAGAVTDKADKPYSDVRFYLDGELLYHYFDGENFVVRVPRIAAHGAVTLTVLSGNVDAADISNKEYVHEVVYGTRESCDIDYKAYSANYNAQKLILQNELPQYVVSMPGGVMWGFRGLSGVGFYYKVSHDGGRTWSNNFVRPTETVTVDRRDENGVSDINDVRGAMYDEDTGRVIVLCTDKESGRICVMSAEIEVTNNVPAVKGEWQRSNDITYANGAAVTHTLDTYSKPVKLSTYSSDSTDAGVDFVVPVCIGADADGNGMVSAVYSKDGGYSWFLSDYQITAEKGSVLNLWENGLTEANILEDDNGRLVMLSRYQYGEMVNFATAYSYDGGVSWTNNSEEAVYPSTTVTAVKSTVYSDNTQPSMYEYGGQNFLFWGGNNVLGGISYMRFPLNVAVSYDNMMTFENIQDIFSRYSMQGMTVSDRMQVTNLSVDSSKDDTVTMIWFREDNYNQTMIIDNFTDYFYRTKGAYDSFENSTVKYEGWSSVYGTAQISGAQYTDGTHSMMIPGGVSVVRSIPYLQNGKIAFDLYLDNVSGAYSEIELESAYGTEYGKAAPIAFKVQNGKLYFRNANGSNQAVDATLKTGWNHFEFDLELLAQTPSATLSVNSGEAVELPINLAIGDYVCYVDITTGRGMDYYVDSFLVEDMDVVRVPGEKDEPNVYGNSILLGKNFAVNYYVERTLLADGGYSNPYMTFALNGKETTVTKYEEVGAYYVFTFSNLAPNQLTDHIYATLHATAADGSAYVSDTTFYSVAKYCYNQLANQSTSAELRTLLVDLLNYGTASQLNKDANATNLANAALTAEQLAWGSKTYDALTNYTGTVGTVENPVATWDAVSLVLKDSVVIRMYFNADDITNLTIKAEGAGKTWTVPASSFEKDESGRYYADFGKLNPAQMREVINFTVYNGNTPVSLTLQYSIESYVCSKMDDANSSDALKALVESMIKYGDATKKYTDSVSGK